jgi:hypothetical protein
VYSVQNKTVIKTFDFESEMISVLQSLDNLPVASDSRGRLLNVVRIPANREPPASLEGQSTVYLLHIHHARKTGPVTAQGVLYVGETESLNQRLREHRQYYKRKALVVSCVAFNVADKSAARALETRLIGELKQRGFPFDRDADATHSLFSRAAR